ncbi:MAG: D-amino-acid dehydrogenase [Saprospiraceae bacterium]|jgi:D-amino-acid dehydrogenase
MKIHIIGGGIIGLCSAYYLNEAGIDVEVIDQSDLSEGCSFGNAGMIVPSHFTPLATPGIITKGIRWMFNPKSPFYIKPRISLELGQWLWQFHKSCNRKKVAAAIPALKDLSLFSKKLYQDLAQNPDLNFNYEEEGLMMLFKNPKTQQAEIEIAEKANDMGIEARILTADQVKTYETGTKTNVIGGVFYPGDAHLHPNVLMSQMISYLKKRGVCFRGNTTVTGFDYDNEKIKNIKTETGEKIKVVHLIVAGGSWTAKILKFLGIKILLQDGKGYSVTLKDQPERPKIPSILTEAKVAITPMGTDLRIGGTLEISNFSSRINKKRVQGFLESVPKYYPDLQASMPDEKLIWHGFRPCSPDGLPYIGASQKFKNLTIASGHAMMGLSLGPATGKLIAEIIQNQSPSVEIHLFDPHRF